MTPDAPLERELTCRKCGTSYLAADLMQTGAGWICIDLAACDDRTPPPVPPVRCVCGELIVPCPHNPPVPMWDHVTTGLAAGDDGHHGRPVPRVDGSVADPDPQDGAS